MRKLLLMLVAAALMLAATIVPAQAHGICQVVEASVYGPDNGVMYHAGTAQCDDPHYMNIVVQAQRRNPGGSWTTWTQITYPQSYWNDRLHLYTTQPYNCNKDFRTRVTMSASGHNGDARLSSTKYHTC